MLEMNLKTSINSLPFVATMSQCEENEAAGSAPNNPIQPVCNSGEEICGVPSKEAE